MSSQHSDFSSRLYFPHLPYVRIGSECDLFAIRRIGASSYSAARNCNVLKLLACSGVPKPETTVCRPRHYVVAIGRKGARPNLSRVSTESAEVASGMSVPNSKRLVVGSRHDPITVSRITAVRDSFGMTTQSKQFNACGSIPDLERAVIRS